MSASKSPDGSKDVVVVAASEVVVGITRLVVVASTGLVVVAPTAVVVGPAVEEVEVAKACQSCSIIGLRVELTVGNFSSQNNHNAGERSRSTELDENTVVRGYTDTIVGHAETQDSTSADTPSAGAGRDGSRQRE